MKIVFAESQRAYLTCDILYIFVFFDIWEKLKSCPTFFNFWSIQYIKIVYILVRLSLLGQQHSYSCRTLIE